MLFRSRLVRETVRAFVTKEVKPVSSLMDREGRYPKELVHKLSEIGLMGAMVPLEYGGSGMDPVCYVIALEEISRGWASLGAIMTVNNSLVCDLLLRFGSEPQKERHLPSLAQGKRLGCYALTEPDAGSDAGSIKTRARRSSLPQSRRTLTVSDSPSTRQPI